jgi:hypothetical protein
MRPVLYGFLLVFFTCLAQVPAFAQQKEFRPDQISGGAESVLRAMRATSTAPFATSPTRGPNGAGFIPGIGFLGYNFDDNIIENASLFIPPDPCGAAGPDRLLAVVNAGIECRDKVGNLIFRDSLHDFFLPLGPQTLGTLCFDPKVVFDQYTGRFVVVALERWLTSAGNTSDESRILMAVSITPNPSTATAADWYFLAIDSKLNIAGTDYWADYPGFEVDEEAVYLTMNMFPFSGSGSFTRLWIIDKGLFGGFYSGGPAAWAVYDPVPPGFYHMTMMPALVFAGPPVVGTWLVGYSSLTNGGPGASEFVQVIRVDNPVAVPTFTGEFVNVGDLENVGGVYGFPALPDAPQSGGPALIEVNDSRALDAVWRNNSLWFTTTIKPNVANDPVNANQTTAHWFRLDTSAVPAPITVAEQGNIGGEDIAPGVRTFFPAVAVNSLGAAKFGFAASGPSIYGGAFFAGRESTDPPGTVQPAAAVQPGLDYYVRTFGGARNRWGDYSGASVDPMDDRTFWIFNQYAEVRGTPTPTPPEDGRWGTAWKSCTLELPPPPQYDFGDLMDPPYPTLLVSNGARHQIVAGVYLGNTIDAEPDGQPAANAQGDDQTPDEDGIIGFAPQIRGGTSSFLVRASQAGWLDVWFDYNANGSLLDPGELVHSASVPAGDSQVSYVIPIGAVSPGTGTALRLRYNLNGPLSPTGSAPNGEVEDYKVFINDFDFGDAPAPYPTLLASGGALALLNPGKRMGATIDADTDGQPHPNARGDDLANIDDEDGVIFTTTLNPTQTAGVQITVSFPGYISAWVDFNHDGTWSPSEKILNVVAAATGVNSYNFNVPATSSGPFITFARFRYSDYPHTSQPTGWVGELGEVEDYEVSILQDTVTPVKNIPVEFALFDPVPNPFNPSTTLSFALPTTSRVKLDVFDIQGHLVATLLDEKRSAGVHHVTWNARDRSGQAVASGVYLCRIQAGTFTDTKRMVLLK